MNKRDVLLKAYRASSSGCAVVLLVLSSAATRAHAQELTASLAEQASAAAAAIAPQQQEGSAPPAVAIEYSDAYKTRAKIHKVASFATLPLFAAEGIVGQRLYNARVNLQPTGTLKSGHLALATGIGALFGINSVTGVWNLIESRHDPNHRAIRWAHGLLMLGADGGFLATAATGPGRERFFADTNGPSTHRAIAFTSIGAATAGYLLMLFGNH